MEELDSLKQIGAKDISKHTHIALNKITYILDCNYDKLRDKATTVGLIQILEREYKVDMRKWLEEYEAYLGDNKSMDDDNDKIINFKVTHEATNQSDSKGVFVLLAILFVVVGIGFYIYSNFNSVTENLENETQKLEMQLSSNKDINKTQVKQEDVVVASDINTTTVPVTTTLDSSASTPMNEDTSLEAQKTVDEQHKEEIVDKKMILKPLENVWVGIIYLDTKQKVSLVTNEPIEIDTLREQTIITGHGMIEIDSNGGILGNKGAERMRFYVDKEGNIKEITNSEYIKYNGGIGW